MSPIANTSGWPGTRQVRHTPAARRARAGGRRRRRAGPHARRPDQGPGGIPRRRRAAPRRRHRGPRRCRAGRRRRGRRVRSAGATRWNGGEQPAAASTRTTRARPTSSAGSPWQHLGEQLTSARRSRRRSGRRRRRRRQRALAAGVGAGGLEAARSGSAGDRVVQRLSGKACSATPGMPKSSLDRAGRDDQVVVRRPVAAVEVQHAAVEVDARHAGQPDGDVGLAPEDAAHRVGDVAASRPGRGHLVQQRLEGVEVVAVDQGDVDRGVARPLTAARPAEAGPDRRRPPSSPAPLTQVAMARRLRSPPGSCSRPGPGWRGC